MQRDGRMDGQTDRQRDERTEDKGQRMKLIGVFRDYAKAPKMDTEVYWGYNERRKVSIRSTHFERVI
jgi:hypothetical protein